MADHRSCTQPLLRQLHIPPSLARFARPAMEPTGDISPIGTAPGSGLPADLSFGAPAASQAVPPPRSPPLPGDLLGEQTPCALGSPPPQAFPGPLALAPVMEEPEVPPAAAAALASGSSARALPPSAADAAGGKDDDGEKEMIFSLAASPPMGAEEAVAGPPPVSAAAAAADDAYRSQSSGGGGGEAADSSDASSSEPETADEFAERRKARKGKEEFYRTGMQKRKGKAAGRRLS